LVQLKPVIDIEIIELDESNYKMVLKGRGLDSKGKGSADMLMNGTLEEVDGKTNVKFSMDITIVGMLAQFGSRLINDVSEQLLNQFVANFKKKLAAAAPAPVENTASVGEEKKESAPKAVAATVANTETNQAEGDNAFDGTSLIGTVIKSIFGGIFDFFKSLFGGKK